MILRGLLGFLRGYCRGDIGFEEYQPKLMVLAWVDLKKCLPYTASNRIVRIHNLPYDAIGVVSAYIILYGYIFICYFK